MADTDAGNTPKNTPHVPGTPWKPGQSGNPNGRPKMPPEEREAWKRLSAKGRAKLEEMLDNPATPPQTIAKIAEVATNRAWGTPVQSVELTGADGGPVEIASEMTPEERAAWLEANKWSRG